METDDVSAALGGAVRRRLSDIAAADERIRNFVFDPNRPDVRSGEDTVPASDAVRDFVLRALSRATDPVNHRILRGAAASDVRIDDLSSLLGLPWIAVSERVNDLVQVGLAGRNLESGSVEVTAGGAALLKLIDAVVEAAGEA